MKICCSQFQQAEHIFRGGMRGTGVKRRDSEPPTMSGRAQPGKKTCPTKEMIWSRKSFIAGIIVISKSTIFPRMRARVSLRASVRAVPMLGRSSVGKSFNRSSKDLYVCGAEYGAGVRGGLKRGPKCMRVCVYYLHKLGA